ncbi:MAG: hypothetical protein HKM07_07330 [Chlamydiae bacterium]|nr:hypothetical protein [Chlamydiota bacterium]
MSSLKTTILKNILFFLFLPIFILAQNSTKEPSWGQYNPQIKTLKWALTPEKQIEWVYDDAGNRIFWKDWSGTTQYTYDNNHHITESLSYDDKKTTYAYNAEGSVNKIVYPSGEQADYTYFKEGLIETVTFQGKKTTFEYDTQKALLLKKHLPNGITTEYQYDQAKRMVSIIHTKSENILIAQFNFEYDAMNNLTLIKKTTPQQEKITAYLYDKLYRLIEVSASDGIFERYSYDALGNRLTKESNQEKIIYEYNDQNQLIKANNISFSYDTNGNLITKSTPKGDIKYGFNDLNQLIDYEDAKHSVKFTYNGQGERLTKTIDGQTTKYGYEDIFPVFHLLEENSENTKRSYFYAHTCLGYSEGEKTYYYLEDSPGSSIGFIVDEKGNVIEEMKYDSFGKCLSNSKSSLQYNAELIDQESGLVFLRTRYYDPSLGRFISSDQFPGNTLQPQTLNRYVYVHNNPLSFYDPMGTYSESKTIEVKQFLWSKGVPIWEKGDPLPPEGYTYVVICARKMGVLLNDPTSDGIFRGLKSWGGHVWLEFIDNNGNHTSLSAHIGDDNSLKDNMKVGLTHPDIAIRDSVKYKYDMDTIRIGILSRNEDVKNIKGGVIYNASNGYNLATCNCIHASKKGVETTKIQEIKDLFYGLKRNLAEEEPSLSLLPHLTPSGVYSSIERFISPYVKMEQDRQAQVYQKAKLEEWMNWQQHTQNANRGLTRLGLGSPFTTPPKSPPPKFTPTKGNFGGISLSKRADLDLALQEIYGAVFDEVTGQLILFGKKSIKLPEMPIDHLSVAFQSIYGLKGPAKDPGVSIEPISENKMAVKYYGAIFGTEFGKILYEGDLTLKMLILGLMPCQVPGFSSHIELEKAFGQDTPPLFSTRTWIIPERISLKQSEDGSSMVFDHVKMRCLAENKIDNKVFIYPPYQAFAEHFTKYYDEIAKEYPIFSKVKLLGQITGVVKWIKDNNIPLDLSFFRSYSPVFTETPSEIKSHRIGFKNISERPYSVQGGISLVLNSANFLVKREEGIDSFKKAIISSRPQETDFSWETLDVQRNSISVKSFPVLNTRKTGNFRKTFIDLEFPTPGDIPLTLLRFYDSFNDQDIGFGRGWALAPFDIFITKKTKIEQNEYFIDAYPALLLREENQHRVYKLTHFDFDGRIWYVREDGVQALCENSDETFTLFFAEGGTVSFNPQGKITGITDRHNITTNYIYQNDRLLSIEHQNGKSIDIIYEEDRIFQAISPQKLAVSYKYDEQKQLSEIIFSNALQITYQYDSDLRLTHILGAKGEILFQGSYDEYNRLTNCKEGETETKKKYSLREHSSLATINGVQVEENYDQAYHLAASKIEGKLHFQRVFHENQWIDTQYDLEGQKDWQYAYDQSGLLLQAIDSLGGIWEFSYNTNRQLSQRDDPKGNRTQFVYDQAKRLFKIYEIIRTKDAAGNYRNTLSSNNITTYSYNELGRVKTIQKGTETTYFSYDENGVLIEVIFPSGYRIKRELDENFQVRSITDTNELPQEFEYDENGRTSAVIELTGRTEYLYNETGKVSKITDRCGNTTEYGYDEQGTLLYVKDADGNTIEYRFAS